MGNAYIGYLYDKESQKYKLPITSIDAVVDEKGKTARELIDEVQPVLTTLIIKTSAGLSLSSGVNTLSATVIRDNEDITDQCTDDDFVWTRQESNWLRQYTTGKSITIGDSDLVSEKATFICWFKKYVSSDIIWEASQQITIDGTFSDNINLIGYITANLPQYVKFNDDKYSPDWSKTNLILTPVLHRANNSTNLALTRVISKAWYRRIASNPSWIQVTSGSNGEVINPSTGILTVSQNKFTGTNETVEYKYVCKYFDNETNKTLDYEMEIDFLRLSDGIDGQNGQDGINGIDGQDGKDGVGIKSITQTKKSKADGGENEWTVVKTDNTVSKFYVTNGTKGSAGINGTNGWTKSIIRLYRRSPRTLTRDDLNFGTLTYDVNTDSILEAHNNQVGSWWTTTIAGSNTLYSTFAVVYTQDNQVVLQVSDWAYPVVLSEQGSSGQEGQTVAFVTLYQRADEIPELPYNNVTFSFVNHTISEPKDQHGNILPWTINVPENNGKILWCTTAVASGRGESDTIGASEWCEPINLAINGIDGRDGIDGINGQDGKDGRDGVDGIDGRDGIDGKDGINGVDGASAYEIAVEHGYEGTEEEWLQELHTEMRFQYAVLAGEYDYLRSYGPGSDDVYGYIDGVGYGIVTTWSDEAPLNVPKGSYVWFRAKNTYNDIWQYARVTGYTGSSAGFGNITASIDTGVGIPSVDIITSGTDAAKNIEFVFKNLRGIGIYSIEYFYAVTPSQIQPPASEIVEIEIPQMTERNKYLWKKIVITYTTGLTQSFVSLEGAYGDTGPQGSSTTITSALYGVSDSNLARPSQWQSELPVVPQGQYLWTKLIYSDGTITYSYSHQAVSADTFYVTREYCVSQTNTEPPIGPWSNSVDYTWYSGTFVWSRNVKHYDNGTVATSSSFIDYQTMVELERSSYIKVIPTQGTYISGLSDEKYQYIPIRIETHGHIGTLSISTNCGILSYYDSETDTWTDLQSAVAMNITLDEVKKDYAIKLSLAQTGICTLSSQFVTWSGNSIEDSNIITPINVE